jgi:hypothetical protein
VRDRSSGSWEIGHTLICVLLAVVLSLRICSSCFYYKNTGGENTIPWKKLFSLFSSLLFFYLQFIVLSWPNWWCIDSDLSRTKTKSKHGDESGKGGKTWWYLQSLRKKFIFVLIFYVLFLFCAFNFVQNCLWTI